MICSSCEKGETQVTDSRDAGRAIRRRRECLKCGYRFTTFERIEHRRIVVIKKDDRREPYDRQKITIGITKACEKLPISKEKIDDTVNQIERELSELLQQEIPSRYIGELVMIKLKELDQVAYIRFASVYRSFNDLASFEKALRQLKKINKEE